MELDTSYYNTYLKPAPYNFILTINYIHDTNHKMKLISLHKDV